MGMDPWKKSSWNPKHNSLNVPFFYQANQDITRLLIKTQNKNGGTIQFTTPAEEFMNMVSIYFVWFSLNKFVYYPSVFPFSSSTCWVLGNDSGRRWEEEEVAPIKLLKKIKTKTLWWFYANTLSISTTIIAKCYPPKWTDSLYGVFFSITRVPL